MMMHLSNATYFYPNFHAGGNAAPGFGGMKSAGQEPRGPMIQRTICPETSIGFYRFTKNKHD
jgi:hypothetical protein